MAVPNRWSSMLGSVATSARRALISGSPGQMPTPGTLADLQRVRGCPDDPATLIAADEAR
jgi:hypothetical protein